MDIYIQKEAEKERDNREIERKNWKSTKNEFSSRWVWKETEEKEIKKERERGGNK